MYKCKIFRSPSHFALERAINRWLKRMNEDTSFELCDMTIYCESSGIVFAMLTYFVVEEEKEQCVDV